MLLGERRFMLDGSIGVNANAFAASRLQPRISVKRDRCQVIGWFRPLQHRLRTLSFEIDARFDANSLKSVYAFQMPDYRQYKLVLLAGNPSSSRYSRNWRM